MDLYRWSDSYYPWIAAAWAPQSEDDKLLGRPGPIWWAQGQEQSSVLDHLAKWLGGEGAYNGFVTRVAQRPAVH